MVSVLRPSTLKHYRSDLMHRVKLYLGQKKLTQITTSDLENCMIPSKSEAGSIPAPARAVVYPLPLSTASTPPCTMR